MLKKEQLYALIKMLSPNPVLVLVVTALLLWLNVIHIFNYSFTLILLIYITIPFYTFYSTKKTLLNNIKKLNFDKVLVKIESKNSFLIEIDYFTFDRLEKITTDLEPQIKVELSEFINSDKNYHFITEPHLKKLLILKVENE